MTFALHEGHTGLALGCTECISFTGGLVPFIYEMNDLEIALCKKRGRERQESAERKHLKDSYGFKGDGVKAHTLGVAGEIGFARFQHLDDFVPTLDTFHSMPDVEDFEVRCRSRHSYDLLVRPGNEKRERYICTTCEDLREVWVWGWLWGEDAMKDRFLKSYGGRPAAYFVPKVHLQPLDLLPWKGVA